MAERADFFYRAALWGLVLAIAWAMVAEASTVVTSDLIQNGSFEEGDYTEGEQWTRVVAESEILVGWTVGGVAVDWHNSEDMTPVAEGDKVVDLNLDGGGDTGTISQSFPTVPDQWYTLSFQLAGPSVNDWGFPDSVGVMVTLGEQSRNFHQRSSSHEALVWGRKIWTFKAESELTTLTFSSLDGGMFWGPALDEVSVFPGRGMNIYSITPSEAINTGVVNLTVNGRAFQADSIAKLQFGDDEVTGTDVTVSDDGTTLTAAFDLQGRAVGAWSISITSPEDETGVTADSALMVSSELSVSNIHPNHGGNAGYRSVFFIGKRMTSGMRAWLSKAGEEDVVAEGVALYNNSTAVAQALFGLSGLPTGIWDITLERPDGPSATLPQAFTVFEAKRPKVQVFINSPTLVRLGRPTDLYFRFAHTGEQGSMDAVGVPIIFGIPKDASWTIVNQPQPRLTNLPEERKKPIDLLTDEGPGATRILILPMTVIRQGCYVDVQIRITPKTAANAVNIQALWDQMP